jgi:CYTH domain-containing protein
MKYARWERERRFLLAGPPEQAVAGARPAAQIEDRYLTNTRLRLRLVRRPGEPAVRKLGQKIREPGTFPPAVAHTSLYLDADEYAALAELPAAELTKTRTLLHWDGPVLAVDVFTGRLAGLVLAEYDLAGDGPATDAPTDDAAAGAAPASDAPASTDRTDRTDRAGWPPVPVLAEVTGDERFTGAALAGTSTAELHRLLAAYRTTSA